MTAKRILVIDDEEDILELSQLSMQLAMGWEVMTASSGSEGLAKAAATRPDAILLDVMMPDMDGPTTLARLQAEQATRDIPVVLLTAMAQAADRQRFKALGVAGIIVKPYVDLAAQLTRILGWTAQNPAGPSIG